MQRIAIVAGVVMAAGCVAVAQTGTPPTPPSAPMVDIGAGLMFTESNDHFDNGVGGFAYVGGRMAPILGLRGTLAAWDCDTDSPVLSHGSFTVVSAEASLLLHLDVAPALHAWAGGGVGGYWFEDSTDQWDSPRTGPGSNWGDSIDDDVGYHAVVGADIILAGPVSFFVEGKYIWLDTEARVRTPTGDGRTFIETREDVTLDTGLLTLGLRVKM